MRSLLLVGCMLVVWGMVDCDFLQCKNKDPCECIESNFTINLREVSKIVAQKNMTGGNNNKYIFTLSICEPRVCNFSSNPTGPKTAAACQYDPGQDPGVYSMLGAHADYQWEVVNETLFSLVYTGGEEIDETTGRQTQVLFKVDNSVSDPQPQFLMEDKDTNKAYHNYIFQVTINKKEEDDNGGSAGSIAGIAGLVIMLLCLLGLAGYCIIGAVVMYKVKGARGAEVIPNYTFWKALPIYIKDGFLFTISPCRRKFGKGYQSL